MSKRLYEIVTDRSISLDSNFINEAFELLINEEKDLNDYITDFKIDDNINALGLYSNNDRIITINPSKIISDKTPIDSDYDEKLKTLRVIRHEMEHARNLKRLYDGRRDIESVVTEFSLVDYIKEHNFPTRVLFEKGNETFLNYKVRANYLYDPGERIADIKANKFIVNLLKNQRKTHDLLTARKLLFYSYNRGYKDNRFYLDAPTYTFLLNIGLYREFYLLKKTVDNSNYSLETRVLCGLPITYNESDDVLLKKVRLQRKL